LRLSTAVAAINPMANSMKRTSCSMARHPLDKALQYWTSRGRS